MILAASFLEVLFKALALIGFSVSAGGVLFMAAVLGPEKEQSSLLQNARRRAVRIIFSGSCLLSFSLVSILLVELAAMAEDMGSWPFSEFLATRFARAALLQAALAPVLPGAAVLLNRGNTTSTARWALAVLAVIIVAAGGGWLVHGASRTEGRFVLISATLLHQIGAAVWAGGVIHLVFLWRLFLRTPDQITAWPRMLERFSRLAMVGVVMIVVSGGFLATRYIGQWEAMAGTAYGSMVVTKITLLSIALLLGALNFSMIRRWRHGRGNGLTTILPAFADTEAGIGIILLLAAASLTSQPPAIDVLPQSARINEVVKVFSPKSPRLTPPPYREVLKNSASSLDIYALPSKTDRLQSDFNHNIAGLLVLLIATGAMICQVWQKRSMRNWPLLFLLLALFLTLFAEPNGWPFGYEGFWGTLVAPGVLQHRLATLVVIGIALFQWRVETGTFVNDRNKFCFPLLCGIGGALLLSHSHTVFALKWAFLIELSHLAIGILAVLMAASKWLELRLLPPANRIPALVWPVCMMLVGYILLIYRET